MMADGFTSHKKEHLTRASRLATSWPNLSQRKHKMLFLSIALQSYIPPTSFSKLVLI